MDRKTEIAVERYSEEDVSLGQAAGLADVSVWRFLDVLSERGVEVNYDESDLEADIRAAESDDTSEN